MIEIKSDNYTYLTLHSYSIFLSISAEIVDLSLSQIYLINYGGRGHHFMCAMLAHHALRTVGTNCIRICIVLALNNFYDVICLRSFGTHPANNTHKKSTNIIACYEQLWFWILRAIRRRRSGTWGQRVYYIYIECAHKMYMQCVPLMNDSFG